MQQNGPLPGDPQSSPGVPGMASATASQHTWEAAGGGFTHPAGPGGSSRSDPTGPALAGGHIWAVNPDGRPRSLKENLKTKLQKYRRSDSLTRCCAVPPFILGFYIFHCGFPQLTQKWQAPWGGGWGQGLNTLNQPEGLSARTSVLSLGQAAEDKRVLGTDPHRNSKDLELALRGPTALTHSRYPPGKQS